ncbi:hypothetical protein OAG1_28050 [Agarivorans sp. OAG1]|uniref:hypothetical protein n=1 Tax=Agarivorans sp. OAG1 TaxID=3082387 RepID=UPI002B30B104|nr:hypothetical protein OAG1_28050 [Agarivorans sp. OAG1]
MLLFSLGRCAEFRLSATSLSFNEQSLAKQKENSPCIFLDPPLRIHKGVEVTRYTQTDFNSAPLFICATRRR